MPSLILPARGNAGKRGGEGKSREETGKKGDGLKKKERDGYVLFLLSSKHVHVYVRHT